MAKKVEVLTKAVDTASQAQSLDNKRQESYEKNKIRLNDAGVKDTPENQGIVH